MLPPMDTTTLSKSSDKSETFARGTAEVSKLTPARSITSHFHTWNVPSPPRRIESESTKLRGTETLGMVTVLGPPLSPLMRMSSAMSSTDLCIDQNSRAQAQDRRQHDADVCARSVELGRVEQRVVGEARLERHRRVDQHRQLRRGAQAQPRQRRIDDAQVARRRGEGPHLRPRGDVVLRLLGRAAQPILRTEA